ncbi:MAG: thioredoxin domain-containing protein [Candidatus Helarchaeota archaeon]
MSNEISNDLNKKVVRIDFFELPTCPHCASMKVMLTEAKKIFADDIEIIDINLSTKEGYAIAQLKNIKATPTLAINGMIVFKGVPNNKELLFKEIEKYLNEKQVENAKKRRVKMKKRVNMMYS